MSYLSQLTPAGPSELFTRTTGVKRIRETEYDYEPTAPPKLRRTMAMTYRRTGRKFIKRYSYGKRSNRPQAGRPELKFRDATQAATLVTASGMVSTGPLNPLGQGTGQQNRIGTKVRSEYISLKGNLVVGPSGQANVHIMVVLDRQPNGALPTFNQVFNSYATGQYMRNIGDNPSRFVTLAAKSYSLSLGGQDQANVNIYIPGNKLKGKDRYTYYNASNTNSIADISTNSIIVFALSDQGAGNAPTFEQFTRYRFKDE